MSAPHVLLVAKGLDLGGLERVVTDLAVGLRSRGIDVDVAVVNNHRDAFVPLLDAAGVTVHRLGGTDRIGVGAALRLRALSRKYDVVHVHGPMPVVVARTGRGSRRRLVSTSHAPWASLHPVSRLLWRLTAWRDGATIAVSDAAARGLPTSSAPITVIPHGVDGSIVATSLDRTRDRADAPCRLVTVASHRDAKNYPNLLHALRHAVALGADVYLVAVGEGPHRDRHAVLADQLGIGDRLEFRAPTLDVVDTIARSDILVVASDTEGQPLVVAEALAVGTPVVSTAVGLVAELVDDHVGRVVPAGDPIALGAAIAELATSPELRALLSTTAAQRPFRRTLDGVIDDHLAVYRSLDAPA